MNESNETYWKAQAQFPIPQLEELDDDTLMKLFNKLDFTNLLEFADISPRFASILNLTMISKFQINEKLFKIGRTWNENIELTATDFECSKYATVLKILRNFGYLITKIEFDSDRQKKSETEEIARQINRYCSKSLRVITIIDDEVDVIEQFKRTFDKVENVTLQSISHLRNMPIHRIFPMMRRLDAVVINTLANVTFLECTFPNLVHLRFAASFVDDNYSPLNNFLRLNPQLTSFEILYLSNVEFLRGVNNFLPKLETLDVSTIPSHFFGKQDDVVRFKNVKNFKLFFYYGGKDEMPERFPFAFDRLEHLDLYTDDMPEQWLESIMKSGGNLKRLILPRNFPAMDHSRLSKIFKSAPYIKEIRLRWDRSLMGNGIDRLMNDDNQLEKILLFVPCDDQNLLLQNVSQAWKVNQTFLLDFESPKISYLELIRD